MPVATKYAGGDQSRAEQDNDKEQALLCRGRVGRHHLHLLHRPKTLSDLKTTPPPRDTHPPFTHALSVILGVLVSFYMRDSLDALGDRLRV